MKSFQQGLIIGFAILGIILFSAGLTLLICNCGPAFTPELPIFDADLDR